MRQRASASFLATAHGWDVHGAKRAGLRTGWVVRKDKIVSPAIAPPDAQGKTLTEVIERLLG
jgi:2-haloacid dehalogenase